LIQIVSTAQSFKTVEQICVCKWAVSAGIFGELLLRSQSLLAPDAPCAGKFVGSVSALNHSAVRPVRGPGGFQVLRLWRWTLAGPAAAF